MSRPHTQPGEHHVLVVLAPEPIVLLGTGAAPTEATVGDRVFTDVWRGDPDHDVLCLYGWVRDGLGDVVGLSLLPMDERAALFRAWWELPYVVPEGAEGGSHATRILLAPPATSTGTGTVALHGGSEENISTGRMLQCADGTYAVVVDAVGLLPEDIEGLKRRDHAP